MFKVILITSLFIIPSIPVLALIFDFDFNTSNYILEHVVNGLLALVAAPLLALHNVVEFSDLLVGLLEDALVGLITLARLNSDRVIQLGDVLLERG